MKLMHVLDDSNMHIGIYFKSSQSAFLRDSL